MRQIPLKLLVVWDGCAIHRGGALKDFLARGGQPLWRATPTVALLYAADLKAPTKGSASTSRVRGAKEPLLPESISELKVELRKAK
jgi:hypothetical protein